MTERVVLFALAFAASVIAGALPMRVAYAQAPIEDELVIQTPVSPFIVDSVFKEFVRFAKDKWNINVKPSALHAGTPISYERIVGWKGQPAADIFWGGESALFNKLAVQNLLVKLEIPAELWDSIPPSIGAPKKIMLKDPARYWVGTALEIYGLVYHPRTLKRLGVPPPADWEDLLNPKLKGQIVQCTPARSSSSHATYEIILQSKGEAEGWKWLKRLADNTGTFTKGSRDVPAIVARGEYAVGFGVPSYFAFEEKLAGFDIKFVAPKAAYLTPEPMAILSGAKHPRAARAFIEFLLSERGQRVFMERGLFPVMPKYRVQGQPGSTTELAVELSGGIRSFFDAPVTKIDDEEIARQRFSEVNEKFQREIESAWMSEKKPAAPR